MGPDPIRGVLVNRERSQARDARAAFLSRYPNPNTRVLYTRSIDDWFEFCDMCSIDPLAARREHIDLWARTLEIDRGNQPATVNTKMHAVIGFYKYAYIDERIDKNPALYINKPSVERKSTTNALTRVELHDFLAAVETTESAQTYALFCLLGYNGLRVGEALALDVGSCWVSQGYTMIAIRRKGGSIDSQPLSNVTAHALEAARDGRLVGPMFLKQNGQRADRRDAGRAVNRVAKRIGMTKHISPHSFRHSFVTLSLNAGVKPRTVQAGTAHRDSRMIDYYDHGVDSPAAAATHALTAYVAGAA